MPRGMLNELRASAGTNALTNVMSCVRRSNRAVIFRLSRRAFSAFALPVSRSAPGSDTSSRSSASRSMLPDASALMASVFCGQAFRYSASIIPRPSVRTSSGAMAASMYAASRPPRPSCNAFRSSSSAMSARECCVRRRNAGRDSLTESMYRPPDSSLTSSPLRSCSETLAMPARSVPSAV